MDTPSETAASLTTASPLEKVKVAVALSGSGFRFPAHVGAIQAILDHNYDIVEIAGVSGGAIVASCYANGMTPNQMMDLAHKAPFQTFIEFDLASVLLHNTLNTGNNLQTWLNLAIGETTTFQDLKLPLHIVATDLNAEKPVVFSQTTTPEFSVAKACRCSASIPLVFEAVEYDGKYLVDGGICNDLPIFYLNPALKQFAVELLEKTVPLTGKVLLTTLVSRILDTFMIATEDIQISLSHNCTVVKVITPSGLSLDTSITNAQIDQLYTLGYDAAGTIIRNS
jgi:NTE family protein